MQTGRRIGRGDGPDSDQTQSFAIEEQMDFAIPHGSEMFVSHLHPVCDVCNSLTEVFDSRWDHSAGALGEMIIRVECHGAVEEVRLEGRWIMELAAGNVTNIQIGRVFLQGRLDDSEPRSSGPSLPSDPSARLLRSRSEP